MPDFRNQKSESYYDEIYRNVFLRFFQGLVRHSRRTWENYEFTTPFMNQVCANIEQLGTKPDKPEIHYYPGSDIKQFYTFYWK